MGETSGARHKWAPDIADNFVSRRVVVEAVQWDGTVEHATRIVDWVLSEDGTARYHEPDYLSGQTGASIAVNTNNGTAFVKPRHWMVKGPTDFYPCDPDTFAARWEPSS